MTAICAGEATLDLIRARASDQGEPVVETHVGGAPVNVAAGLHRYGMDAALWSAVGSDDAGRAVLARLEQLGIGTASVAVDPFRPTRVLEIETRRDGVRHTRVRPGDTADQFLRSDSVPPGIANCGVFYLSGAALLGDVTADAVLAALRVVRRREKVIVAFDPNIRIGRSPRAELLRRRIAAVLAFVDVVQVTVERMDDYWPSGGFETLRRVPVQIYTAGADGAEIRTPKHAVHVAAVPASVVDTTGAGDAFMAAMLTKLVSAQASERAGIEPETLRAWGRLAAEAAAEVVATSGGTGAIFNSESAARTSRSSPALDNPR